MASRWPAHHRRVRGLGIGLLILSLGHTPLPKADYHNIRHHDEPGQVCEYHDHLVRWHPQADRAEDIPVLHWHWFLPTPGMPDTGPMGQEPGLHSRVPDWSGLAWDDAPQLGPEVRSRFLGWPRPEPRNSAPFDLDFPAANRVRGGLPRPIHTFGATFAPRIPLNTLLQCWVC